MGFARWWPAMNLWWTCRYRWPKVWTNVSLSLPAWLSTLLAHMVAYPAVFINPATFSSKVCSKARPFAPLLVTMMVIYWPLDFAAAIIGACGLTSTSCLGGGSGPCRNGSWCNLCVTSAVCGGGQTLRSNVSLSCDTWCTALLIYMVANPAVFLNLTGSAISSWDACSPAFLPAAIGVLNRVLNFTAAISMANCLTSAWWSYWASGWWKT